MSALPFAVTDYSKDENWLVKRCVNIAKYDVVFFYGTGIAENTWDNGVGDICDKMRTAAKKNFIICGSQLSFLQSTKKNRYIANVFIPLYRQVALNYALAAYTEHEEFKCDLRNNGPYRDIKAALDYYFENFNRNAERPFVLSGHSQGSAMLQVVLEEYFIKGGRKAYLKNMIAAYSTGYGVSKKWFDGLDKKLDGEDVIHFATGATDTNCLISWNTEGPGYDDSMPDILLPDEKYDTYIINPLNWRTDETPATRNENFGVLIDNKNKDEDNVLSFDSIVSFDYEQKFNAQIDLRRGSLICTEHKGTYVNLPPFGAIWGGTSLHCSDGSGFFVNMGRNLGDRIDAFLGK